MAFNNIMQLATATLVQQNVFAPDATVVEWGNQRFRYSDSWIDTCAAVSGKTLRKPTQYVWEYFEDLGFVRSANTNPADFLLDALSGMIAPSKATTSASNSLSLSTTTSSSSSSSSHSEQFDFERAWREKTGEDSDDDDNTDYDDHPQRSSSSTYNTLRFSKRVFPSFLQQTAIVMKRNLVRQRRQIRTHVVDVLMVNDA